MDANPQSDRGQRSALQLQRRGYRVGGAGESRHEAVALALFDRAHAVMFGDGLRHRLIQSSQPGRHLIGLGFP
jgi:hypothetical protein